MSIYATWLSISGDDHEEGCAIYREVERGVFELSGDACDCGLPRAPIIYKGSHVLPSNDDARGGSLDVAGIPEHVRRDGRSDAPEGALKDWVRLSVYEDRETPERGVGVATVVLTREQVERLRGTLTAWLERGTEGVSR